jgi:hypothetical protein
MSTRANSIDILGEMGNLNLNLGYGDLRPCRLRFPPPSRFFCNSMLGNDKRPPTGHNIPHVSG